jgi:3'(2'), 5'-bisphosphate nucleotidase
MLNNLMSEVVAIAELAGAAIMNLYSQANSQIAQKSDQSPITLADNTSNQIIEDGLRRLKLNWPIISEESAIPIYPERKSWEYFWLIDPLDGTKEFIKKNGEFTVNIALIKNGQPILGVVFAPAIDECYFAYEGHGAFLKTNGYTTLIQSKKECSDNPRLVISRSHIDATTENLILQINNPEIITLGSSLKICLVAQGKADCYPRLGPTMEWDTAAAHAISNEAGCILCDINGEELTYNKESLKNENFMTLPSPTKNHWISIWARVAKT